MADGLTIAACDSIGGRGYTAGGKAAIIIAIGIAAAFIILAFLYGYRKSPLAGRK
jgi:hypothetical protein